MKKLCAVLCGFLLFILVLVGFKLHMDSKIYDNKEGVRDLRTYERYWSSEAQQAVIDSDTLPVFGSSELRQLRDYDEEVSSFLNGDQMNIIPIGAGSFQSLSHAITLGSLAESIDSKKVALFLSPQWFDEDGCQPEAFAARMSENELLDFICNPKISKEQKLYVLERAEELLAESPMQLERVQKYHKAIKNPISPNTIYMHVMNVYWDFRAEYEVYKQLDKVNNDVPHYDLESIDFDEILALAEKQGQERCTNNDMGIYDDYWVKYVSDTYERGEVTEKTQKFTDSPEYDDLRCFLSVAKELDIEVILVSIPVNSRWYGYKGMLCDEYYGNVANIAAEYDNVIFADMSVYEDELYFLKDIMHLGWKGWARINEILYTEFTKE